MDEFSSGDQAPEWSSSSNDDSFSYEDEDSHQGVENTDNVESSIEKDDDKLNEADKAQIVYMKEYGFQTSQIVGILAKLVGGYGNLNFTKKDVYNFIDRDRCAKIEHKDAAAVVAYLQSKADVDPMFVARYTLVNSNKMGNLFWADGLMINDY
ncbi:hypothetical protein AHAS_Ahas20G0119800 [Arachis hypogaea]